MVKCAGLLKSVYLHLRKRASFKDTVWSHSPTWKAIHHFRKQPLGMIGMTVLFLELGLVVLAPHITPYGPAEQRLAEKLQPPSWKHLMGTDNLGRDIFSRVIYGGRNTLGGSILALLILTMLGVAIGGVAGFFGGVIDMLLMRLTDAILSFPYLVLALGLAAAFSPSLLTVVMAISFTWWAHYARIIRGMILSIRETDYVEAARSVGSTNTQILRRHILPNVLPPVLVLSSLDLGLIILSIAALSYLGLGIQPPTPEWGMMLNEARLYMFTVPHVMVIPGAMIFISVLAANLFGDALRDAFDPRQRHRKLI